MRALILGLLLTATAHAQFQILPSPTTADLRGIQAVSHEIAWASGTNGTVLRTIDAGTHWTLCPTPPGAEHLDFRGIQAFDAQTAIVMSSGLGPLSRLYKTTDACATWTLLFTNPDPQGSWAAIAFEERKYGLLLGEPVVNKFIIFTTADEGKTWNRRPWNGLEANPQSDSAFAVSNSSLITWTFLTHNFFVTGGQNGASFVECHGELKDNADLAKTGCNRTSPIPLGARSPTSGAFSLAETERAFIAVGGDYQRPNNHANTAAYSLDAGGNWQPAQTPPHGFRSSVAYSPDQKTWITVGPNGTDISTDDGRNWRALKPSPGEAPDSDRNWNALSLPYVVGPHGRIGKLRPQALK